MMNKIINYVLNLSPKKLAIYLVLGPMLWFFAYIISTIAIEAFSEADAANTIITNIVFSLLFVFLATMVLLWFFWLHSIIASVEKTNLGLPLRWFYIALALFIAYLLYNLCNSLAEGMNDDYQNPFSALSEFIAFGGLLIAYPLLCHYAARAVLVKKTNRSVTLIKAIPFTLLLFFGGVLGVPFLHKYFSTKTSTNSEITTIYVISFSLFVVILIIGFLASVTGLI